MSHSQLTHHGYRGFPTRFLMRLSTVEGGFSQGHQILTAGMFITILALALGARPWQIGFLAAIPHMTQLFQLIGAYLVEATGRRKLVAVWGSALSRLLWLAVPLLFVAADSIDVMLVLLIVFMVTAPLLNQGIEVELPQANNEPLAIDQNIETLVVSITSNGEYYLSVGATGEDRRPVTLETLGAQVGRIMSANPRIQVLVEGDSSASWGAMITLITTLNQAGVSNPSFITQPLNSL